MLEGPSGLGMKAAILPGRIQGLHCIECARLACTLQVAF